MIINQGNLQTLFTGYKAAFNTGFRSTTPMWNQVATLVPSTTREEKYGWLGQYPRLREWQGDRVVNNIAAHDYAVKNKTFESTIAVPREDIEDDTYGVYQPLMQEMGFAASTHPDELIFGLLAAGFTTQCFDKQYFFDTDHPVGGVSVSNYQAGGASNPWFLLDTRRPLRPLIFQRRRDYAFTAMTRLDDEVVFNRSEFRYGIDARLNVGFGFWQQAYGSKATLTSANFNSVYAAMMGFKSEHGRPLGIRPNLLVVGPSNRASALQVIKAEQVSDGTTTVTNINREAVDVLVVPWLL